MPAPGPEVVIRRVIRAPAERVYDAWTNTAEFARWFIPGEGIAIPSVTADVRVGGSYEIRMDKGGTVLRHYGVYRELVRPTRIAFTWHSQHTEWQETLVTIDLVPRGGDTELTLRHAGLAAGDLSAAHRDGWTSIAGHLDRWLGGRPPAVDVMVETGIAQPAGRVAAFAGDPGRAPEWYVNILSVEWKTPPPLRIGSRMAFVAAFLGQRLAYTYEVVELDPERRLVMRTAEGPFPMETTYTWEADGPGRTRMTLRNRGTPSGFSRILAPFMAAMMRRAMRKDLARLKALLERGPEPGRGGSSG